MDIHVKKFINQNSNNSNVRLESNLLLLIINFKKEFCSYISFHLIHNLYHNDKTHQMRIFIYIYML